MRSTASKFRQPPARSPSYNSSQKPGTKPQVKSCPLCKQAGSNDRHFLNQCTYLPAEDRAFLAKARLTSSLDDEDDPTDSVFFCPPETEDVASPLHSTARIVSRRVSTKQSPHFNAFYRHHPLKLTLDTGAETSMIKASVARNKDVPIVKTSQQALQADGVTPLVVVDEAHLTLSRADKLLTLDALVVEDLDVDVLAGTPFMITNDISVRPAKGQVLIQDNEILAYNPESNASSQAHAVRRTQSYVLRSSAPTTVILPGEYLELDIPPNLYPERTLAIEPRTDAPSNNCSKVSQLWPQNHIVEAVANRVRILNNTPKPRTVRRHEHLCQARHTTTVVPTSPPDGSHPSPPHPGRSNSPQSELFSDAVKVDPDNILPDTIRSQFRQVLQTHDEVFNPTIVGYNGTAGPVQASYLLSSLSASPHRITALATCRPPESVKGLRSFIGAYKVLNRVLPHCSQLVDPLESALTNLQSHDHVKWDERLRQRFIAAQDALNSHKSIVLPRASDQLWIVTDGSVTKRGLGATLYVTRQDHLHLAGFYSSKLRKHQVTWLPCEVEALSIAAAVKHFSTFIIQSKHRACVLNKL